MDSKRKKKEALKQFGKRLSQLRKERKLSFRKLAAQCDIDYSDIKKFENGDKNVTILTLIELSIGLDIHPKELLNFDVDFLKEK
ncbi:MAG TPA: helix-turn-helix transcriptional regulator [Cyclobacteriaceae bacterium]|nr:helix-turn-helix transcriptional regulator [Cyclobacteriaceae bacterium]HRF32988.1 helix-turn-helix transcriptional regulator [Cyclobacteriaceae bacterium]